MSPECVCEVLAQNTLLIFIYSMLKLSLGGWAKMRCFCLSL